MKKRCLLFFLLISVGCFAQFSKTHYIPPLSGSNDGSTIIPTRLSPNLFAQGSTIASTIANEFNEAGPGSMKLAALLGLGLMLFIISFIVLAASRALVAPRAVS